MPVRVVPCRGCGEPVPEGPGLVVYPHENGRLLFDQPRYYHAGCLDPREARKRRAGIQAETPSEKKPKRKKKSPE